MYIEIFQDALFSAIAAIGFAAISRPPKRAYLWCALIAAVAHSARFVLLHHAWHPHIVFATFAASLLVGIMAVLILSLIHI